ncbi:MAG: T9SS type A sorting domain-containing protein, partial [Cytophagales bacterium]
FGTPSIASQNFDELGFSAAEIAQFEFTINNYVDFPFVGLVNYNPHLKYVDLKNHGYFILDLNKFRTRADYFYVPTVTEKADGERFAIGINVKEGETFIEGKELESPASPKVKQDIPAPNKKLVTNLKNDLKPVIFQVYPNPAKDYILLHHGILKEDVQTLKITNSQGRTVKTFSKSTAQAGLYEMEYYVGDLQAGTYFVVVETKKGGKAVSKLIKE